MKKILIAFVAVLFLAVSAFALSKPEVIKCDVNYSNNAITVSVHWQSENPVTKVSIFAGPDLKEIAVDEYDNRRNPQGYSGEVSAVLPIATPGDYVNYVVFVEDDLRQKSEQSVGKVVAMKKPDDQLAVAAPQISVQQNVQVNAPAPGGAVIAPTVGAPTMPQIQIGVQPQQPAPPSSPGAVVGQIATVLSAIDLAPAIVDMVINRPSANSINVKLKVTDDKNLKHVTVKVLDAKGSSVQEQAVPATGSSWEGNSPDFTLNPGTYTLSVQAVDEGGNLSKAKTQQFVIQ